MRYSIKKVSVNFVTIFFIFLFTYTAFSKLMNVSFFQSTLVKSPLIGNYSKIISYTLPVVELAVAALLVFPMTKSAGLCISFFLILLFTAYLIYMIFFTHNLPCSCGGLIQRLSWQEHLLFNLFLTMLASLGLYLHRKQNS